MSTDDAMTTGTMHSNGDGSTVDDGMGKRRAIRIAVAAVLAVVCALSAFFTLADIHTPVRSGMTLAALIIGTGWAVTCWIDIKDAAFAATIAVASGVSVFCFYALLFVEIHWWHPVGSVGALLIAAAVINAAGALRELLRRTAP
jgi:hypothetical protein